MLATAGATPKLGRVDDGSTTTDWDEESIARKMTTTTGVAYAEWGKPGSPATKVNILDTPGFNMFVHEAKMCIPAVESFVVVVDGVAGVEVVTEKVWQYAEEANMPRAVVVSRMDRERADYDRVMESLVSAFGRNVVPIQLPIGKEKSLSGVVDLVRMKAYTYEMGGSGKGKEGEIPAALAEQAKAMHEKLVELIAEGKDELMEEFFEKGTIPEEDLIPALHDAIKEDRIFPVLFTSGLGNVGTDFLMDFIVQYTPTPGEHEPVHGIAAPGSDSKNGDGPRRHQPDTQALSLFVFQTTSDQSA